MGIHLKWFFVTPHYFQLNVFPSTTVTAANTNSQPSSTLKTLGYCLHCIGYIPTGDKIFLYIKNCPSRLYLSPWEIFFSTQVGQNPISRDWGNRLALINGSSPTRLRIIYRNVLSK